MWWRATWTIPKAGKQPLESQISHALFFFFLYQIWDTLWFEDRAQRIEIRGWDSFERRACVSCSCFLSRGLDAFYNPMGSYRGLPWKTQLRESSRSIEWNKLMNIISFYTQRILLLSTSMMNNDNKLEKKKKIIFSFKPVRRLLDKTVNSRENREIKCVSPRTLDDFSSGHQTTRYFVSRE